MIDNMNLKQSFLIQLYKCSHHTSCRTLVVWMWDPLRLCRILQWVSMLASSTGYFPQGCSTHFPRPPRRVHPVCPSIGGCICRTTWKDDHVDYESSTTSFYTLPASLSMRSASYTVTPICCRHGAEKSLQTSCTRISHDMSLSIIHDPTPGCKAGHPSSHPIGTSIGPRTTRLLDSQDLNRTWATRIEAHAWIILEHLWMSSESSVRFEDDNIPPPPSVCTNQKLKLPQRWGICLFYSKSVNGKQPPTHYSTWMAASYSCAHATHVLQLGWISEEDIGYTARARKSTIALQTSLHSGLRLGFFTAPDSRRDASKSGCVALCRYLPPMRLKDYLLGCGQKRQKT